MSGRAGAHSGLHFDLDDNLFFLARGEKSFFLYEPTAIPRLGYKVRLDAPLEYKWKAKPGKGRGKAKVRRFGRFAQWPMFAERGLLRVGVCSVADAILAQFHLLLPQVNFRSTDFIIWDVGGADKIRPLWQHYVNADTACLCWWIDCNDRDRLAESIEEL